jgi:hypothetical protein
MKLKSLIALHVFFIFSLLCNNVRAEKDFEAGRMHVQISNETNTDCRLISYQLYHGILDSAPPSSIMPNDAKSFDMMQSVMGPEVVLYYTCEDKNMRLQVQQNYSFLLGNTPYATVLESHGLAIETETQSSSVFWGSPGIISITLKTT